MLGSPGVILGISFVDMLGAVRDTHAQCKRRMEGTWTLLSRQRTALYELNFGFYLTNASEVTTICEGKIVGGTLDLRVR